MTTEVAAQIASATPMMRQYLEVKARYPDAILFFRLGDFYEMFFDDATRAAEILQITLTARAKGDDRVPMCGVPHHAAKGYIAKLVEHGLKVAICDQVSEAGGPGIVQREVTRVVTPGMALDEDLTEPRENRFLVAITFQDERAGLALLDASTGEFRAGSVPRAQLLEELARVAPRELVVARDDVEPLRALIQPLPQLPALNTIADECFEPARARGLLTSHLGVASLDGFGLGDDPLAVAAAGAALRYLCDTQKAKPAHVDRIAQLSGRGHLRLDESSRANLEILRTLRDGKRQGSLVGLLDRTATAVGGRMLAGWLVQPLYELQEIDARLDAVDELRGQAVRREEIGSLLREVSDLERLTSRLALGQGSARDLAALARSLGVLPQVAERLADASSVLLKAQLAPLGTLGDLAQLLRDAVVDEPPAIIREGGMIRRGWNQELDKLVDVMTRGKDVLLALESREKERTGIGSLKVRFNKVFGYYLEVTKPNLHLVPKDWIRKQTTAGGERFVTEELKEHEELVLTAEEKRVALELRIFEELRQHVVARASKLREAANGVGVVDALCSFARCAAEHGYCRPVVDDGSLLEIVEGRHPVVERNLGGESFVPNDLRLDGENQQLLVITGPNMAGKSTVMRQAALIALMAQAGCFVPAKRARVGRCDRIFTRVGASDNLARGQSTFMVEMTETANILHNATARSLVILDEIGRGTSTFDGLSIAWAVAEHLHDTVGARTLFATHYHELTDLSREKARVKNATIAVKEWQGRVIFLRKLIEGGASRSYGIEVAKLAGLPAGVLGRAREILKNLEASELDAEGRAQIARGRKKQEPVNQLGLFAREGPSPLASSVEKDLRALAIDGLTPLEALNLLATWKKKLGG